MRGVNNVPIAHRPATHAQRSRGSFVTAIAPIVLLLTACGTGTPSTTTPSSPPAASSLAPTVSPLAGRLPIGRVVVNRLSGSPEGGFLGAFVLGVDGAATPLKLPTPNGGFTAIWSPDGARLLVNAFTETQPVVGTFDPTTASYGEIHPDGMVGELECTDWTPDASHVICSRGGADPANDGIYTVDVASGAVARLTTSPFHHVVGTAGECGGGEGRAVYSADGSRFAFVQQKCGAGANPSSDEAGAIAVASADGSNQKVIVPLGGARTHPGGEIAWSPTDDVIAFGTQDGRLSVIRADGSALRTIDLPRPGFVYGPTWSPDGKWLLVTVVAQAIGQHDLFVVAPDGSTMLQVTDTPEVEAYTDWGTAP
jgi:Tol biopolymer transport system component